MSHGAPDYTGMKVDVVLRPEWAAVHTIDKSFIASDANVAWSGNAHVSYVVPAGKTLFITDIEVKNTAFAAANGDLPQMCAAVINDGTPTYFLLQGGDGGVGAHFIKPLVFQAGVTVTFTVENWANHATNCAVVAMGYEE